MTTLINISVLFVLIGATTAQQLFRLPSSVSRIPGGARNSGFVLQQRPTLRRVSSIGVRDADAVRIGGVGNLGLSGLRGISTLGGHQLLLSDNIDPIDYRDTDQVFPVLTGARMHTGTLGGIVAASRMRPSSLVGTNLLSLRNADADMVYLG